MSFNQYLTVSAALATAPGKQKASRGWESNTGRAGTDSSVVCQSNKQVCEHLCHCHCHWQWHRYSHRCHPVKCRCQSHPHSTHGSRTHSLDTYICIHRYIYMLSRCTDGWLNKADGGRTCCRVHVVAGNFLIWVCCWKACRPNAYGWLQRLEKHAVELLYCTWSYRRSLTAFVKWYEAKCLWEWGGNSVD